jgi:Protein of unknown function (DUF2829)
MNIGEAVQELRAGKKVNRLGWCLSRSAPSFLVLIPGREIKASYAPMVEHMGEGQPFIVDDHIDAIFLQTNGHPECVIGYTFTQEDILGDDWVVVA